MRAIFISYRRDDSEGHAGRLFEDLCARFGKDSVFMDVAGIEPGRDFRRVIEEQVASCGVLLAIIGKNWLTATDAAGHRRLDNTSDFVRLETANALKRDIPVIPVLVHDATMPDAEHLPADLKDLAFRNSVELTHARWGSDVQLLINALMPYVDSPAPVPVPAPIAAPPAPVGSHAPRWVAPVAVLALGAIGYVAWDRWSATRVVDEPVVAASAPLRVATAASSAAAASAPASAPASAAAPSPSPAPRPAVDKPAAPVVAASKPAVKVPLRETLRPMAPALAEARPGPAPSPAPAAAPVPAVMIAAAPAPAPATEILSRPSEPGLDLYGSPASAGMATRTIVIAPGTNYVNVTGGEIIRFDVDGKSFVWNFNGQRSSFDLARVAPPSLLTRKVMAYVAPNPMYPRRN